MENHIAVHVGEITGYKNAEEYTLEKKQEALTCLEQELKKTINVAEDNDATIHGIKHPEALYTQPLFSEIINQVSLINFSKKQAEKLKVKQSIRWIKFKFTSFD